MTDLAISTLIESEVDGSEVRSLWAANWAARPTIVRRLELSWYDRLTRDLENGCGYIFIKFVFYRYQSLKA